jgi:acetyl-CoA carboxylase carboxyl transferase subunit alpha
MLGNNLIDGIIEEPLGGAHNNIPEAHNIVKQAIKKYLAEIENIDPEKRINQRIDKFCAMGVVVE